MPLHPIGMWHHPANDPIQVTVAATKSIFDLEGPGASAFANVTVDEDGNLRENKASLGAGGSAYEVWLDAGVNTDAWVQMTVISGSFNTSAGTGRLSCVNTRVWGIQQLSGGLKQTVLDLKWYDAASGGNLLDTQRVTLHAEIQDEG